MKSVVRGIVQFSRLPLDFVILTGAFLKLTVWQVRSTARDLLSGKGRRRHSPCGPGTHVTADGKDLRLCPPARKYGNPGLLGLLCPALSGMVVDGGKGVCGICGRQGHFKLHGSRYVGTGLLLLLFWLAVGLGAWWLGGHRLGARLRDDTPPARGGESTAAADEPRQDRQEEAATLVAVGEELLAGHDHAGAMNAFVKAAELAPLNVRTHRGLAAAAAKLNRHAERRAALSSICRLDPTGAQGHRELAEMDLAQGHFEGALKRARHARLLAPFDIEAVLTLSRALSANLKHEDAAQEIAYAMQHDPTNPAVFMAAGNVELSSGDLAAAATAFEGALAVDDRLFEAHVSLAGIRRRQGRLQDAAQHLDVALKSAPDSTEARIQLAELHIEAGNLEDAIVIYRALTTADPSLRDWRARLAELLIVGGRPDDGYDEAMAVLEAEPGHVLARLVLASLFLQRGLASAAIEQCQRALIHAPGDVRAYRLLARSLMERGRPDDAVGVLERVVARRPDDIESQTRLGICYNTLGRFDDAVRTLESAAAQQSQPLLPLIQLGQMHLARGNIAQSLACYRRVVEHDPNNLVGLNNMAVLLIDEKKDIAAAYDVAQRAFATHPDDPAIADTLAWVKYHRGEFDEALALLRRALPQLPRNPTVHFHMGMTLHAKSLHAEAREHFTTALGLGNDFKGADHARRLIAEIDGAAANP